MDNAGKRMDAEAWSPSPSPIALFLLSLEEQGLEGAVEVGERVVVLRRGRVVDVRRASGDPSLHEFLRDSGRIGPGELNALQRSGTDPDRLPEGSTLLAPEALGETMRALWLDRLVRGMARAEAQGRPPPPLRPEAMPAAHAFETALVPLLLDALQRRAQEGDAEQVGLRATHKLEWLESAHSARARRWSGFSGSDLRVAMLLSSTPAAASRIAALVRAGLARVVPPGASVPPAPARRMSFTAPAFESSAPQRASLSIAPPRPPKVRLSPGAAQAFADLGDLSAGVVELPMATEALEDPLDAVEPEIAALEAAGASGPERAQAWQGAAEAWRERYGSIEERERALREAAAASPADPMVLLGTADACAAMAHADLAMAYGRAAVAAVGEGPAEGGLGREQVLIAYALLCRRIGKGAAALSALRAAFVGSHAALARQIAGAMLISQGRAAEGEAELIEAAVLSAESSPATTTHLGGLILAACERAGASLSPQLERALDALVAAHEWQGRPLAAVAVRALAASALEDIELRRKLLLTGAEMAQAQDRPLLAADFILQVLDAEPDLAQVFDPLDKSLAAAGAVIERAVVLEEIAASCVPEARVGWLARAGDARLEVPGDGSWELELRIRCLEIEPENAAAMNAVRRQAEASGDPLQLADALERAARATGWTSASARRAALDELAQISDSQTHEPLRAVWARSVSAALGGEPIAKARQRFEPETRPVMQRAAELERISRTGEPAQRADATVELARILAQDPERRDRAVALVQQMLSEQWDDRAADVLERIHTLRNEVPALLDILEQRAERASSRVDRVRRWLRIAAIETSRGELREAAEGCLRALEQVPGHREAVVRLRRAAARLRDPELLRDALEREARLQLPPQERARALTTLAVHLKSAKQNDRAQELAAQALEAAPDSPRAAMLFAMLSPVEPRDSDRAFVERKIVERALTAIGPMPSLLALAMRFAPDTDSESDVAAQWSEIVPAAPEPWLALLAAARERRDLEAILEAIDALLEDPRTDASLAGAVAGAIEDIAAAGSTDAALARATSASDRFGDAGAKHREIALRLIQEPGHAPALEIAALERSFAGSPSAERALETLRTVAARHRRDGDAAGEARTWLRLLARAPRDREAIDRLTSIYAATGEHDRLMAVLALRVAEGASDEERLDGWLALATASVRALGNGEAAEGFVRSALEGSPPVSSDALFDRVARVAGTLVALDRGEAAIELLRREGARAEGIYGARLCERAAAIATRVLGEVRLGLEIAIEGLLAAPGYGALLVAFEQLALEVRDVPLARKTYEDLIERAMGPSGRRALVYRRARWMERGGSPHEAIEAYLEAAQHSASPGAILTGLERLARAAGDLDALAKGLLILADNAPHHGIKLGLIQRAAQVLDAELGRPERSWEILFPLWKKTGLAELEEELGRLGSRIVETDPEAGARAFDELFAELGRRAGDAWMGDEKARLLMKAARLHARARNDLVTAEQVALEALAALRSEDPEPQKIADLLAELASWLGTDPSRISDARARAAEAIAVEPTSELANRVARELGAEGAAAAPSPSTDAAAPSPSTDEGAPPGGGAPLEPAAPGGRASPIALPELDGEGTDGALLTRTTNGVHPGTAALHGSPIALPVLDEANDADALEARAASLAQNQPESPEAAVLFRTALTIDPSRVSAIEGLYLTATRIGAHAEAAIARAVLSLIEPAHNAPTAPLRLDGRDLARSRGAIFRNPEHQAARELLAIVWESAMPLFRSTLQQLSILGTDRVATHGSSVLARALGAVLEALPDENATVFSVRKNGVSVVPIRTQPLAVLVGSAAPTDEPALRFLLGRALELADPEHILIATLDPAGGRNLLDAIRAGFGPAGPVGVPREAAALGSELWRIISPVKQREIAELISIAEHTLDYDALHASIFGGAARAGLVASGDLVASIRALCREHEELVNARLAGRGAFAEAVSRSSVLADLLRFAFADAFVDAVRETE